jgi:hypothetical protein
MDQVKAVARLFDEAGSSNGDVQKPAEAKLKELEPQAGFQTCLLQIFVNGDGELAVRLAAVLFCKNGIQSFLTRCAC